MSQFSLIKRKQQSWRFSKAMLSLALVFCLISSFAFAKTPSLIDEVDIDRIQLVTQQIDLLKDRLKQAENDLKQLQKKQDDEISPLAIEKASKNLLDKASLDISVAKSNLDGINIELADSRQTIIQLEKNIQEIENQLNVMGMFGVKAANNEVADTQELRTDLHYQQRLLHLEKLRVKSLQNLQTVSNNALTLKKDKYNQLSSILRSRKILHLKQQQMQEELAFQREQNHWLQQLNHLYAQIAIVDPIKSKALYTSLERDIFYTNENANFAYSQSLVARYTDQIQQMKLAISKNSSISLLNDVSNQVMTLIKQVDRLDAVLKSRISVLNRHVSYLTPRQNKDPSLREYVSRLSTLEERYDASDETLMTLNKNLGAFRLTVDKALQVELSSRQGLPNLGYKTMLALGKEMLLVPGLTYQVVKSLSAHVVYAFESATMLLWGCFALLELAWMFTFAFLGKWLSILLERPSSWRDQINSKWLSLQCFRRNLLDLALIGNVLGAFFFFGVPSQQYMFIVYFSLVWLTFKNIITVARLCLVETTHNAAGHDMRLYSRLKWFIFAGGLITAFTVFVHQLPFIYEIKAICDQLFLFLMMMVSILLLRSWDVVPNLILAGTEERHPYLQKSIRLIWFLIPILMLGNSVIGLLGFVNLIMTVSWYEGIFLIVLIGYLILRGLLSDGMELLSRVMIQYVHNGWLWTEAFLKPIDKVLRMGLFLTGWAVLFLLYGWDKQSPIVVRLMGLLHYQLVHALNTTITPLNIIALFFMGSIFYWTAKWTREFVYRLLMTRTKDMGIRNSIAILSQYSVVLVGGFICLRVLGIDMSALAFVASMFAFGIGFGLRDLANNFVCGFLILLERPLRVGDIVDINGVEGEVTNIGGRAVTVKTWDHMELVVPNAEIFNKSFTNWTAKDNTVRTIVNIKISRYDDPHAVRGIIQAVFAEQKEILKDPAPEVFLKDMSDILMEFELRYFVNIRMVKSRMSVASTILMNIWDEFAKHGIKPPYPQQEIFLRGESSSISFGKLLTQSEKIGY
jgi:potassium efflux system protein